MVKKHVDGFVTFIREQGVMGLAIGFILGGSVSTVAKSLVADIVMPVLGIVLGSTEVLADRNIRVGKNIIMWGHFVSTVIDFLVIAAVVYFVFKGLGLDRLDRKKEAQAAMEKLKGDKAVGKKKVGNVQ